MKTPHLVQYQGSKRLIAPGKIAPQDVEVDLSV